MARILIWKRLVRNTDSDIFGKTDYRAFYPGGQKAMNVVGNTGNKLWLQGIVSMLCTQENEISFVSNQTIEQINREYDLIVLPMATFSAWRFAGTRL